MKYLNTVILLAVLFSIQTNGQNIVLKKSYFSGYSYSIDSVNYEDVDSDKLKDIMKGNNEAAELVGSYQTNTTISQILGVPGGFLVGWPLGGYLGSGGKWKDEYNTMLIAGGGLIVLSIIFESTANNRLEEAVQKYNNSNEISFLEQLNFNIGYQSKQESVSIYMNYRL